LILLADYLKGLNIRVGGGFMSGDETKYRQNPNIVLRKVAGEALLIPVSGQAAQMQQIFALNHTAETVWAELKSPCTISELGGQITARFEVEQATAENDARELITELLKAGIVEEVEP
jgi:hypothetical protein